MENEAALHKVRVVVMLKAGVLDAQGATIGRALSGLGFGAVTDVRVGKVFELTVAAPSGDAARRIAEEASKKLLANPVVESFRIEGP
jgi:phosphoribosylformylglycinamidine synthase